MAIKRQVTFKGFPAIEAHVRVASITIHEGNSRMSFGIHYSASPTAPSFEVGFDECSYDLHGDNPVAQAYAYLKTLSDFEGAEDV